MKQLAKKILVTGATGYVGGRLVPLLLDAGHDVRCFVRNPMRLKHRPWEQHVTLAKGNVFNEEELDAALQGIDIAYYMIHSLGAGEHEFAQQDRDAASNFARAASKAGVKRIIYLGGLRPKTERISEHLKSRLETGDFLRSGDVPVTEFRAGVIVGSGSLSFELIRYLTERLPVLVTPKWVNTKTHPIAIRDVLNYLISAIDTPESEGEIIEIGGNDILSYKDMFQIYAKVRGLRRYLLKVPVLTPRLSSHWISFVTPINAKIAKPLIKGLDNEVTVQDNKAAELFGFQLMGYKDAVEVALKRFDKDNVETSWSDALSSGTDVESMIEDVSEKEGLIQERLQIRTTASPESVFSVIKSLGGKNGWFYANPLWTIRAVFDLVLGGVGLRKGRRSYTEVREGDTIDFWRVESIEENKSLRLRAEMKVPGKAWLQYTINRLDKKTCIVTQTALFEPRGLFGFLYWYMFYIPHRFIFPGMFREIRKRAEAQ
ncbi:MAG: SDR family oxidoreductase [Rhodothermales bacterium]